MSVLEPAVRAASALGGQVLRGAVAVIALRPAAKPFHPRGTVERGRLLRYGGSGTTGAPWLDEPGEDVVLLRRSRAVGLPSPLPDFHGLALRVPTEEGYGDLLFATTGLGRLTRYTLTPARSAYSRPMTTLLPYLAPAGRVLLAAAWTAERTVSLSWARASGDWEPFGELTLPDEPSESTEGPDAEVSFDPVAHAVPGLRVEPWVRRLRQPAYLTARRSRGSAAPPR